MTDPKPVEINAKNSLVSSGLGIRPRFMIIIYCLFHNFVRMAFSFVQQTIAKGSGGKRKARRTTETVLKEFKMKNALKI